MSIIRWLHISDLHFGHNSYVVDKMRNGLLTLSKDIKPIKYLFITGDLRYGKTERFDYPDATVDFVKNLQTTLNIDKQSTYIVPGNHDVNRSDELKLLIDGIKQGYRSANGEISTETIKYIQMQRGPFLTVCEELCGRKEPAIHYSIETEHFNIIHINTAILSSEDGEDGDLIIGTQLLQKAEKTINPSKPSIVLAHHPFDSLRIEEQEQLEIFLKEHNAILYLCGHKHVALSLNIKASRQDSNLWLYACGTNMDIDPQLGATDMDIFIGEIDTDKLCGNIQAYKWSKRNSAWIPDSDFSFPQNGALDGKHYFPPDARPRIPKIDYKSILDQYRKYIQFECGDIQLNGLPVDTEVGQRKFALESLFVPLLFKKHLEMQESSWILGSRNDQNEKYALDKIISKDNSFHVFFLSGPGGGKTTILKWIASVYAFPEKFKEKPTYLPNRELFPIWIKCRDIDYSSHPSILDLIGGIIRQAELIVDHNAEKDFIMLIHKYINTGKALLLIDGLDEINDDRERMNFASQICRFVHSNPQINVIVTSRISGFSAITGNQFDEFDCYEIIPFRDEDIKKLCSGWYRIVVGDYGEVHQKAEHLAETIIKHKNIKSLASNPLMLTTLLLVDRRVGRLPAKRVALYSEAIQVLLETWNLEAHEPVDLDETRYQLAYVAYKMMTEHKQIITRRDLIQTLISARKELDMLVPSSTSYVDFIKKVERRSALLIQKGYKLDAETGQTEAIYEFQHLTFQEYLAAYAIANKCYPGAKRDDSSAKLLEPYLTREYMKEVVLLSAALMDRWSVEELIDTLIHTSKTGSGSLKEMAYLRLLLLQVIVDEVPLSPSKRQEVYKHCFESVMRYEDIEVIRDILKGKYAEDLTQYMRTCDMKDGVDLMTKYSAILVLSHPELDVYKHYLENRFSNQNDTVLESLAILDAFLWINYNYINMPSEMKQISLKSELFAFAGHSDFRIRERALSALRFDGFLNEAEDYAKYIDLYVLHINKCCSVPNILECVSKHRELKNRNLIFLTSEAIAVIQEKVNKFVLLSLIDYREIQTLYLILIQYTCDIDISLWLDNLMKTREKILANNENLWNSIKQTDMNFLQILELSVLDNSEISTEKRQIITQYIANVKGIWDKYEKEKSKFLRPLTNPSGLTVDTWRAATDADIEELLKDIDRRLKELDAQEKELLENN